ncbi:hypothetical protein SRHO_G00249210 [Serrasalmus rhombeus]
MEPRDALDYACVKNAILQKFEISPETYGLRFHNDVVGEDESPRELYVRIKGLYEKWMQPNTKTKEQIGETIILEQFLKVVNPDLRCWILERGPSSVAEAAKMAEAYITARRAEGPFQLGGGNSEGRRFKETVLIDLLTDRQNESEVLVATRQRAKSAEEGNRRTLSELPFSDVVKAKKSKRERRRANVRGTKITEPVAVADLGSGLTNPSLAELQKNDTTLQSLFLKAVQGTLDRGSLFVIRDQILYRQKGEQEQLVVPKDLRAEVKMGHSEQWAGHMGKAKTLSRILARFYWPGLHLDVVSYCCSCPVSVNSPIE